MIEINKIYNENCLDTMKCMPDNFIDLTVTSPPYDNLRDYKGYTFPFEEIAKELYRITKEGGILVWVVNDSVIQGSETLNSFRQAIYFKDVCGFKVHDTMIWLKSNFANPSSTRYHQLFEYMFIFCKGNIKTFNPIKDKENITKFKSLFGVNTNRLKNGEMKFQKSKKVSQYGMRGNTWKFNTVGQDNPCTQNSHPAMYPEKLANDHIISWSDEGHLVYDPFMGSGTTAKMCIANKRNWIGSEISKEYCEIIKKRIKEVQVKLF